MGIVANRTVGSLRASLPHLLQTSRAATRQFSAGPGPLIGTRLANSLLDLHSVVKTHKFENTKQNTNKKPLFGYLVGSIIAAIISGIAAWFFSTIKGSSFFPTAQAQESSPDSTSASAAEKSLPFDSKSWHQVIRNEVSKEDYQYSSPQIASDIDDFREDIEEKLDESQEKFLESHVETAFPQIFEDPLLTMEGIAILAAYLREKKGVENLFVCKSLEAFQAKLNEISRQEGNARLALVLSLWPEQEYEHDKKDGEYGTSINHKIAVGIEKTDAQIRIAILDPLGVYKDEISPALTLSAAKDLKYAEINGVTNPLWYIYHSALNMKETSVYYSKVKRQKSDNGCETFALSDSVAFLRDSLFFENIQTKKLRIKEGRAELILHKITLLPPRFMRGAQSIKLLTKYYEKNENPQEIEALKSKIDKHLINVSGDADDIDVTSLMKVLTKYFEENEKSQGNVTLKIKVDQHQFEAREDSDDINVKSLMKRFIQHYETENLEDIKALTSNIKVSENLNDDNSKLQNHLMNQKSIKYHLIVAAALEKIPAEELQGLIRRTLLTVPRYPLTEDQDPQTLSDIHLCKSEIVVEQL